jgi:hypothetical protein
MPARHRPGRHYLAITFASSTTAFLTSPGINPDQQNYPFLNIVYLIPGRGAHPHDYWYPWVKSTLEQAGFAVTILQLPDPDKPKKSAWMKALMPLIGEMNEVTYLIGQAKAKTLQRYFQISILAMSK